MRIGWAAMAAALWVGTPVLAQQASPTFRANPGAYFGPDAYPPEALRNGEQGRVVARLAISETGAVTGCEITTSSGSASLDAATCAIALRRVTFTPATDAQGRAIAGSYLLPVRWALPSEPRWPFAPWSMGARIAIDGAGVVTGCTPVLDAAAPREDPCLAFAHLPPGVAIAMRGGKGAASRDAVFSVALVPGGAVPVRQPRARQTGSATARLAIDADGRVTRCTPLARAGVMADFPSMCDLKPGPFEPAPGARQAVLVTTVTAAAR